MQGFVVVTDQLGDRIRAGDQSVDRYDCIVFSIGGSELEDFSEPRPQSMHAVQFRNRAGSRTGDVPLIKEVEEGPSITEQLVSRSRIGAVHEADGLINGNDTVMV
jgi:hypothetical protein